MTTNRNRLTVKEVSSRSRVMTAKKCTNWKSVLHGQRCGFCLSTRIASLPFSLPSVSQLLKVPIAVIQKFCYHGNVTSHFFSLFCAEVITQCLYPFIKCFVQRYEEDMKQISSGSTNYDGDVCKQSIKTFSFFKFQSMAILTICCNRPWDSFKPKCSLKLDH